MQNYLRVPISFINVLGTLVCLSNERVYHRRAARMLTTNTITEREVIISKLNEELVAHKEAMDET